VFDPAPLTDLPQPVSAPRTPISARFAAAFEVFLISGVPTQILLIAALSGFGMAMRTPEGAMSPAFVFTVSLVDAVLVVALVTMLLHARRESFRDVLFGQRPVMREISFGIALIPVVFLLVIAVMVMVLSYAPWLRNVPKNPLEDLIRNRFDAAIFAVVVMIAGGVREEVQRGFIVHRFEGFLGGGGVGVLVYSLLFGLGHFEQGWDATIVTACLGVLWGLVYLRRRSIIAPMVSHAGFNLAQVAKAVVLRGMGVGA
jgi:membrane protease YdiL (CAAX protease family)